MKIVTCEQVSCGHPDKICDQIADAIVADCLKHDPTSRVAIECLFKSDTLVIAGEITSKHRPDFHQLVYTTLRKVYKKPATWPVQHTVKVHILVEEQSPDIALGVDKGGAGDQGIMYGYATNETEEMLPLPFVLATKFLRLLHAYPNSMFKADAKAQVSFDYDTGKITTFLCSVQHSKDVEVKDFRHIVEGLMVLVATAYDLNTDFEMLVNPTGRFVQGGPLADCGVTGRKLACDTYGGVGRMGGGAFSGKDPSKVDRCAAYMARKIARDIVSLDFANKCEVQLAYAIGMEEPVGVDVDCFDTEDFDKDLILKFIFDNYDLTPKGIIQYLNLLKVDYTQVSSLGHFGKKGLPWEQ